MNKNKKIITLILILVSILKLSISQKIDEDNKNFISPKEISYLGSLTVKSLFFSSSSYLYLDLTKVPDNSKSYYYFRIEYDSFFSSLEKFKYKYVDSIVNITSNNFKEIYYYSWESSSSGYYSNDKKNYEIEKSSDSSQKFLILELVHEGDIKIINIEKKDNSAKNTAIIIIVVVVVIFVIILVIVIVCLVKFCKRRAQNNVRLDVPPAYYPTPFGSAQYVQAYPQVQYQQQNVQYIQVQQPVQGQMTQAQAQFQGQQNYMNPQASPSSNYYSNNNLGVPQSDLNRNDNFEGAAPIGGYQDEKY